MINKKKYFLNAHIIDPCNSINEVGGIIIDEHGKIEATGKRVNKNNIPMNEVNIFLFDNSFCSENIKKFGHCNSIDSKFCRNFNSR